MEQAVTGRRVGGRPKADRANPIDIHVGTRVKLRRTLLGLSQEKLGEALDLTFQQIQKYERGANRIGASRLHQLSRVLDVPVSFFFDDMAETGDRPQPVGGGAPGQPAIEPDLTARRETMELVRAYYRIPEPGVRKRLFDLIKAVASSDSVEKPE
jgi:transcriptional regulator with XRE-family HTH domain